MEKLKKVLRRNYYFWRFILNRKVALAYLLNRPVVENNILDILPKLIQNGIAVSNAENIVSQDLLNELVIEAEKLRSNNMQRDSDKTYAKFYVDREYDANSIWARIAESPSIKSIARHYFKMTDPRLVYYDLWENLPSGEPPKNAQLWHRDRDDLQILKVFIYLSDVSDDTGSFYYAPGTHVLGREKGEPGFSYDEGGTKRTDDNQMGKVVSMEKWISGAGKKLSIVFADTHGYHKGGYVKKDYRFLFTCMYLSPYSGRVRFSNVAK